jgi:hypothetical protein
MSTAAGHQLAAAIAAIRAVVGDDMNSEPHQDVTIDVAHVATLLRAYDKLDAENARLLQPRIARVLGPLNSQPKQNEHEPFFGCFTGDCYHQSARECYHAIRDYVATLERDAGHDGRETERIIGPFAISIAPSGNITVIPLIDNLYDVTIGDRHRRARDVMVHAARGVRFTRDGGTTIEGSSIESR